MEKKKISPRIEDQSRVYLSSHFSTLNAGAEYVLDGIPMLYNRALHEIRGHFGERELSFLVEAFKETKLSPQLAGQQFKIFCDDAITFRQLDAKWKIKSDAFLKKVEDLTSFQMACLEIWAKKFWFAKWKKGDKSLREYVKVLT
ncbi:hypothetical protein GWN26_03600 [Candidatus Saccharibacteria bacterium]|jgi:hypothetical protein|nr:hypothetical protein [Candidatus Saccharibacteria bacterium]